MGDESGYDDQFNDGLFGLTLHASKRARPDMWPKSVSEMRGNTSYGEQKMTGDQSETWHSDYMARRASDQPAFYKDSGVPREGSRPGLSNGGHWYLMPHGGWAWFGHDRR